MCGPVITIPISYEKKPHFDTSPAKKNDLESFLQQLRGDRLPLPVTQKGPGERKVYLLTNSEGAHAYLKICEENPADGYLEKLATKVAKHFPLFADFCLDVHRIKSPFTIPGDQEKKMYYGIFQRTVEGKLAREDLKQLHHLPRLEVIKAILFCYVLGMNDVHLKNFLLTNEGKLRFFDNERFLSPSNDSIFWGGEAYPFFRCALMGCPQSAQTLRKHEWEIVKTWIADLSQHLPALKSFLLSAKLKKKAHDFLQPHFDLEKAYQALEERIVQLSKAASTLTTSSIRELICRANPSYKLYTGLLFAKRLEKKINTGKLFETFQHEEMDHAFLQTGKKSLFTIGKKISHYCHLGKIKSLAADPALNHEDFFKRIQEMIVKRDYPLDKNDLPRFFLQLSPSYDPSGQNASSSKTDAFIYTLFKMGKIPLAYEYFNHIDERMRFQTNMRAKEYRFFIQPDCKNSLYFLYKKDNQPPVCSPVDYWTQLDALRFLEPTQIFKQNVYYKFNKIAEILK